MARGTMDHDDQFSPVDTESGFARAIRDHLELKNRNADLDCEMPIDRYLDGDPLDNHPLFKSEEQARIEETLAWLAALQLVNERAQARVTRNWPRLPSLAVGLKRSPSM